MALDGDLVAVVDLESALVVLLWVSVGLFKADIRLDWSIVLGGRIGFLGLPLGRLVGCTVGCSMDDSPIRLVYGATMVQ